MLPRGELTRDQLSSLLLVYVANAADIMGKLSTDTFVTCTLTADWWKEVLKKEGVFPKARDTKGSISRHNLSSFWS